VSSPRILVYVQNLLGVGHYKRAAIIARTAAARGLDVTLVSGGGIPLKMELGTAELVKLPPTRVEVGDFKTLYAEDGSVVDNEWRKRRSAELLGVFQNKSPQVLVTELFPFGRRQMQFELVPLLDAARGADSRPIVVSSIRDILVGQDRPGRAEQVCDQLEAYFDHVLVHADPRLVTLEATFPNIDRIKSLVTYTGYIAEHFSNDKPIPATDEVLVSAGSGVAGQRLMETALACRRLTPLRNHAWRFLVGSRGAYEYFSARLNEFDDGVIIEPARPDFPSLLRGCALSISQGGYNTIVETLQAKARAVIVPFADGDETEQTMRAELLVRRGLIEMVPESELSKETLAAATVAALQSNRNTPAIDLSGAEVTAELLERWTTTS
jgi:predicted glycosyltransferase